MLLLCAIGTIEKSHNIRSGLRKMRWESGAWPNLGVTKGKSGKSGGGYGD